MAQSVKQPGGEGQERGAARDEHGRKAAQIQAPVLFCVCDSDTDTVAPAGATLRHARRALHGEIKRYADGHFDLYVGPAFERVVKDQLDFLRRHVPLR